MGRARHPACVRSVSSARGAHAGRSKPHARSRIAKACMQKCSSKKRKRKKRKCSIFGETFSSSFGIASCRPRSPLAALPGLRCSTLAWRTLRDALALLAAIIARRLRCSWCVHGCCGVQEQLLRKAAKAAGVLAWLHTARALSRALAGADAGDGWRAHALRLVASRGVSRVSLPRGVVGAWGLTE